MSKLIFFYILTRSHEIDLKVCIFDSAFDYLEIGFWMPNISMKRSENQTLKCVRYSQKFILPACAKTEFVDNISSLFYSDFWKMRKCSGIGHNHALFHWKDTNQILKGARYSQKFIFPACATIEFVGNAALFICWNEKIPWHYS